MSTPTVQQGSSTSEQPLRTAGISSGPRKSGCRPVTGDALTYRTGRSGHAAGNENIGPAWTQFLEAQLDVRPNERLRIFLVNWFFTSLCGMTIGEYVRLLRRHRFAVAPVYLPRAAFMAGMGVLNSVLYQHENRVYGGEVACARIKPPLFILGHWRSGTTHLHNLLATDTQFAYPTMYQVLTRTPFSPPSGIRGFCSYLPRHA